MYIMFIKVVDKFNNTKYISDTTICEIEDADEYMNKVTIKTIDGSMYYKYGVFSAHLIDIINRKDTIC